MNKRLILFLVLTLITTVLLIFYLAITSRSNIEYFNDELNKEYYGLVFDIYSSRKNVKPTFLKIKSFEDDEIYSISVLTDVINFVEIGDTVIKPKASNNIIIKKSKETKSFKYLIK